MYEHCWDCPYGLKTSDVYDGHSMVNCCEENFKTTCESWSKESLRKMPVPQWCPLKEKEKKQKNVIPIVY